MSQEEQRGSKRKRPDGEEVGEEEVEEEDTSPIDAASPATPPTADGVGASCSDKQELLVSGNERTLDDIIQEMLKSAGVDDQFDAVARGQQPLFAAPMVVPTMADVAAITAAIPGAVAAAVAPLAAALPGAVAAAVAAAVPGAAALPGAVAAAVAAAVPGAVAAAVAAAVPGAVAAAVPGAVAAGNAPLVACFRNLPIRAYNKRQRTTHQVHNVPGPYRRLEKVQAGNGAGLPGMPALPAGGPAAQAVAAAVAAAPLAVGGVPPAGVYPASNAAVTAMGHADLEVLSILYNETFDIVAGDNLDQRREKFQGWLCEF